MLNIKKVKEIIDEVKENSRNSELDIIIPREVMIDKELKVKEKFYLCQYLLNDYDIRKTDNMMRYSPYQLRTIKKRLYKLGYISKRYINPYDLKSKTINFSHLGLKCEWCGKECYVLHKHHFPISSKDGGKEIVNICPNCHYTFHKLEEE